VRARTNLRPESQPVLAPFNLGSLCIVPVRNSVRTQALSILPRPRFFYFRTSSPTGRRIPDHYGGDFLHPIEISSLLPLARLSCAASFAVLPSDQRLAENAVFSGRHRALRAFYLPLIPRRSFCVNFPLPANRPGAHAQFHQPHASRKRRLRHFCPRA
jgi:hypothetical protein